MTDMKLPHALTLTELLPDAQRSGYAVAAFSARYRACVQPVLQAAVDLRSPVIIEISQRELGWFGLSPRDFRDAVEQAVQALDSTVPLCLHLDHSWENQVIHAAIEAGFTSVMIDASAQPFEDNIRQTREIVDYAHARGVSVEAELGKLTTTDQMETEGDEALYTVPEEALEFVERTGCDVLAVSIGTAHGVYQVAKSKNRLRPPGRHSPPAARNAAGAAWRKRPACRNRAPRRRTAGRRHQQDEHRHRPRTGVAGGHGRGGPHDQCRTRRAGPGPPDSGPERRLRRSLRQDSELCAFCGPGLSSLLIG